MASHVVITDGKPSDLADLLSELRKGDADAFVSELAAISSVLELQSADNELYNRVSAITLATAWIEATGTQLAPQEPRQATVELFRMANGLPLRTSPEIQITGSTLSEHNRRVISRSVAQQSSYIDAVGPAIGRTEILLGQALPAVLKGRPNPLDALPAIMKMSYSEARALSIGLYTWMLSSSARTPIDSSMLSETTDPGRFGSAVDSWARTRVELHAIRCGSKAYGYTDASDFRFTYSVLRDHPLVRIDGGMVAPIPRHLALRFGDGVYDFLRMHLESAGKTEAFDQAFGDATEEYVRLRFERALGSRAYLPLPVLPNELSPDGITADGECVFELKGKRLPRGMITTGQLFAATQFLGKKGLGRGVAQLLAEVQRTRAGRARGLLPERVDDVSLCLVTPEGLPGFHFEPIRQWVVRAFDKIIRTDFPDLISELPALSRLEWLSFDDLDALVLASQASATSIGRLLRRFRLEAPKGWGALESKSLGAPLPLWLRQRQSLIGPDIWLKDSHDAVVYECVTHLFGSAL